MPKINETLFFQDLTIWVPFRWNLRLKDPSKREVVAILIDHDISLEKAGLKLFLKFAILYIQQVNWFCCSFLPMYANFVHNFGVGPWLRSLLITSEELFVRMGKLF